MLASMVVWPKALEGILQPEQKGHTDRVNCLNVSFRAFLHAASLSRTFASACARIHVTITVHVAGYREASSLMASSPRAKDDDKESLLAVAAGDEVTALRIAFGSYQGCWQNKSTGSAGSYNRRFIHRFVLGRPP
jgi:hypothetical protein